MPPDKSKRSSKAAGKAIEEDASSVLGSEKVLSLHDYEGLCDFCGAMCDSTVDELNAINCSFEQCPSPTIFHQHCVETYLKSIRLDKQRKTGFQCPRGCGKATTVDKPCPGRVQKSHPIYARNDNSKKRRKAQLPEALQLAAVQKPPLPKPKEPATPKDKDRAKPKALPAAKPASPNVSAGSSAGSGKASMSTSAEPSKPELVVLRAKNGLAKDVSKSPTSKTDRQSSPASSASSEYEEQRLAPPRNSPSLADFGFTVAKGKRVFGEPPSSAWGAGQRPDKTDRGQGPEVQQKASQQPVAKEHLENGRPSPQPVPQVRPISPGGRTLAEVVGTVPEEHQKARVPAKNGKKNQPRSPGKLPEKVASVGELGGVQAAAGKDAGAKAKAPGPRTSETVSQASPPPLLSPGSGARGYEGKSGATGRSLPGNSGAAAASPPGSPLVAGPTSVARIPSPGVGGANAGPASAPQAMVQQGLSVMHRQPARPSSAPPSHSQVCSPWSDRLMAALRERKITIFARRLQELGFAEWQCVTAVRICGSDLNKCYEWLVTERKADFAALPTPIDVSEELARLTEAARQQEFSQEAWELAVGSCGGDIDTALQHLHSSAELISPTCSTPPTPSEVSALRSSTHDSSPPVSSDGSRPGTGSSVNTGHGAFPRPGAGRAGSIAVTSLRSDTSKGSNANGSFNSNGSQLSTANGGALPTANGGPLSSTNGGPYRLSGVAGGSSLIATGSGLAANSSSLSGNSHVTAAGARASPHRERSNGATWDHGYHQRALTETASSDSLFSAFGPFSPGGGFVSEVSQYNALTGLGDELPSSHSAKAGSPATGAFHLGDEGRALNLDAELSRSGSHHALDHHHDHQTHVTVSSVAAAVLDELPHAEFAMLEDALEASEARGFDSLMAGGAGFGMLSPVSSPVTSIWGYTGASISERSQPSSQGLSPTLSGPSYFSNAFMPSQPLHSHTMGASKPEWETTACRNGQSSNTWFDHGPHETTDQDILVAQLVSQLLV